jgi:ketosteroid isomerase-like protein
LAAAALAACTPAKPAVDTAKIAEAVKADALQRIADVNAHDAAKVASHDAADAVSMFHGRANAAGPAAIETGFQQSLALTPDLHVVLTDPSVDVAAGGDMAVFRATTTATYTDPKTKAQTTVASNSLSEYKPQADGSWKIVWSVVSDVAPAPAPAVKG